jgi:hypothetical protein
MNHQHYGTGGLMQLVAYGAQDAYLTGNPIISFGINYNPDNGINYNSYGGDMKYNPDELITDETDDGFNLVFHMSAILNVCDNYNKMIVI